LKQPGVAIVGCGLIGRKRADALGDARLIACADIEIDRARALASHASSVSTTDWREVINRDDVDVVIVSTINSLLAEISAAALNAGKHVLVEKPAGRNVAELDSVIAAQKRSGKLAHVGFNHRYHPALLKAKELFDQGALGEMMFVRGRYGHGGRIGYEKEWRADPKLAGGGELIDQGVHLIDLARMFLGDFETVDGFAATYFWDMPVDDNAFLLLRTRDAKTASLHVSCTEWKNLFSLEIYGRNAKLHVEGLGGSYGLERLAFYRMLPEMGPPETTIWEFPRADESWRIETAEFLDDIRKNRKPSATLEDARAALSVVKQIYDRSGYESR
jgi:predicted dehydrogenase